MLLLDFYRIFWMGRRSTNVINFVLPSGIEPLSQGSEPHGLSFSLWELEGIVTCEYTFIILILFGIIA